MNLAEEKLQCPVCHAYLFEEDDTVFCPVCGAPHHRECYRALGHCGLAQLHGTSEQYDLARQSEGEERRTPPEEPAVEETQEVECGMCGARYDSSCRRCPSCGAPNPTQARRPFAAFDYLGGVPADFEIAEGISAEEATRLVMNNTPRYIRKFAFMKEGPTASWNWLAFLFPGAWLLGRKMYFAGIVASFLTVAASLLTAPLSNLIYENASVDIATRVDAISEYLRIFSAANPWIVIAGAVGAVCLLALRVVCGVMGDRLYRDYTVSSIRKIRASSDDVDDDYRRLGGINVWAMLAGLLAAEYLPGLIAALF